MDEPLLNLDAQLRAEMRREIVASQRRLGLTMIYVTHDQTEAMSMADQVVVLRSGRLEQAPPPVKIYEQPATQYVAGFIGSPPMNRLPLEARGEGMIVAGTDGPVLVPRTEAPVIAAIRPEALSPAAPASSLALGVEQSEYLGADTVLTSRIVLTRYRIQARLPGRQSAVPGETLRLGFLPEAVHLCFMPTPARGSRRLPRQCPRSSDRNSPTEVRPTPHVTRRAALAGAAAVLAAPAVVRRAAGDPIPLPDRRRGADPQDHRRLRP